MRLDPFSWKHFTIAAFSYDLVEMHFVVANGFYFDLAENIIFFLLLFPYLLFQFIADSFRLFAVLFHDALAINNGKFKDNGIQV